jgi:hypothetical protein
MQLLRAFYPQTIPESNRKFADGRWPGGGFWPEMPAATKLKQFIPPPCISS